MALHRQGSGSCQVGLTSLGTSSRFQDYLAAAQNSHSGGRPAGANSRNIETSVRTAMKQGRGRRLGRSGRGRQCVLGLLSFLLLAIFALTILGGDYLFSVGNIHKGHWGSIKSYEFLDNPVYPFSFPFWFGSSGFALKQNTNKRGSSDKERQGNLAGPGEKGLFFGKSFVKEEELWARDSRDWDKDDRQRDRYTDYDAEDYLLSEEGDDNATDGEGKGRTSLDGLMSNHWKEGEGGVNNSAVAKSGNVGESERQANTEASGGLYNERGRKELRMHEELLEAAFEEEIESQKKETIFDMSDAIEDGKFDSDFEVHDRSYGKEESITKINDGDTTINLHNVEGTGGRVKSYGEEDEDTDYDDDGDGDDEGEDPDELGSEVLDDSFNRTFHDENISELPDVLVNDDRRGSTHLHKENADNLSGRNIHDIPNDKGANDNFISQDANKGRLQKGEKMRTLRRRVRRRVRQHKHSGSSCEIGFRNSTKGIREPEVNPKFAKFSLKYIEAEERPEGSIYWEPRFAGHQSLAEREESFQAKNQTIHCGFVQGPNSSSSTGFDLAEDDAKFLRTCHVAVSSCIFGNSDNIRSPRGKKSTGSFKGICFVMFVDERSLEVMISEGQISDTRGYVGLWKLILVRNLPYLDARRTGKIPKFLTHRLFPAARYSIWLDSKLRLQYDPILILEHFLWRTGHEYAISNHYDRHCVWEEVQQNKRLNKFNHTVIDEQFAFYQADGLTKFNGSDSKRLLPSYVPEGSFIVRAHTPMSNLFSCLWFNEVDRFTSRDQLSFAYTYLKLVRTNPDKPFYLNMFKDCERRTLAKLFHHRRNVNSFG